VGAFLQDFVRVFFKRLRDILMADGAIFFADAAGLGSFPLLGVLGLQPLQTAGQNPRQSDYH
jgi:hypothetical protein